MDRRHFIKLTAITGTTAALTACGNPENQVIRFIPEEDLVPGVATWKPSICPLCSAGCGVIARVMEGDAEVFRNGQAGVIRMGLAKKLEGNPEDAISQGKLCARGQAAIQITYHPDRLDKPRKRNGERGSGQFVDITWDEAIKELTGKLDALVAANDQASLALLTKPRRGRRLELISQLLATFGAKPAVTYEVFSDDVLRRANAISFGSHQLPTVDLENARYVISFGADFLGSWNSAVAQSVAYGRMRQASVRPKFVHVDARLSQTAANADEFVACKPGTEGLLALAIARGVAVSKDKNSSSLAEYTPAMVSEKTGVPVEKIERLAREFATYAPAVAIIGGAPLAHTNAAFHADAVNALNRAANAINQPGGVSFVAQGASVPTRPLKEILDAAPKVLLIDDVNPVHGSPAAWKVADKLKQVPFIVSFGSFVDETSVLADLILPDHSFLESWVDAAPESGSAKAVRTKFGPVMKPLYDTRSTPDVLLAVAKALAKPLAPALPNTFEEYLNAAPENAPASFSRGVSADEANRRGGTSVPPAGAGDRRGGTLVPPAGASVPYADPVFDGDVAQYPYHFLPYASQSLYDGSLAHLPWLQEMPDPMTSGMWCSWVEINEKKAIELGIAQGDLIEVASTQGSVRAPAFLNPGLAPDAIAMPTGQGHTNFTRYASNRGVNPLTILAPTTIPETGTLAWSATRVKITRVGGPEIDSLILFGGATRERPDWTHGIRNSSAIRDLRSEMPFRWGMAVNLDTCTGCEACVTACHAENNIATVSPQQAARGRAMHWLRVERYFEGDFPDVRVKFRPVLCQQCDNAPCEAVCPTYAAHHNEDGLNAQVYNRCIGTRYCANACSYNVRFFNFFNPEWPKPLNLQLNPDVSIREVGVMEKCTFCVQRIKAAKVSAKAENRAIADGTIQPACAQACPTSAIVFGDLNDPNSRVARLSRSPRGSKLLEDLGAEPKITYLSKQFWNESDSL